MFGMNPIMKKFPIKRGIYHNSLIKYDDRSLSISRNISRNLKENFLNQKQKHNVSLKLWHEVNTKTIVYFLVDNKQEPCYDSYVKVLPKPSADDQMKIRILY